MIRRLNEDKHRHPHRPAWPDGYGTQLPPLFVGRGPLRKLVVLLDVDVVTSVEKLGWGKEWLLSCLLALDIVELVRYSDVGPPADAPRVRDEHIGEWIVGWAVLGAEDKAYRHWPVRWSTGDQAMTDTAVTGDAPDVAAMDTQTEAYGDLDFSAASGRRRADALAALVAEAVGADIFVTDRPYLHALTWRLSPGVTYCGLDDTLALVGLYQRVQGSFVVSGTLDGRGRHSLNRGLYYWVGTRELLPAAWRWFAACVQHARGSGDDGLIFLGQSLLQRVQRALQVRDDVHVALNKPQNNDTADEALMSLDVVLLLLMGAVDVTARVMHRVLQLDGKASTAGWQYPKWVKKVAASEPTAAEPLVGPTDHKHVLTILRQLRNSIHGEALSALGVSRARERAGTLVGLRVADQNGFMQAVNALGGPSVWSVQTLLPGQLHADPGILLEELLPGVLRMLNAILEATPVEQLPHVNLRASDLEPPTIEPGQLPDTFSAINRQSIRWQLGL